METYYNITEPGIVEIGVVLTGSITSDVIVTLDVINATAIGNIMCMVYAACE